jgi:hypothetical protein
MLKTRRGDTIGDGAPRLADDLLIGIAAIANHLGVSFRRAQYMIERDRVPTFRRGKLVMARASELDRSLRSDTAA